MTTTPADRPVQLRLPGQAAAPDGPVDMKNMYLFHHAFRRDLDAFVAAVAHTPLEARDTWVALADRWELFAEQLHVHHSHEDEFLWPALLAKATPDDVAMLEAMEAEHAGIDPLLEGCRDGFQRLRATPDEDERAALGVRLSAARDDLGRHLAHEETDAMAMLQRTITPEEWLSIEKQMQRGGSLRHVVAMVPWAAYGVAPDVLRPLFAQAGGPLGIIWRLTRRRFARREAAAFAYA